MRFRRLSLVAVALGAALAVTASLAAAGPLSWGTVIEVPGTAALNLGGVARMNAISCPTGGSCTGVGAYTDQAHAVHGFVVDEKNGVWGNAVEVAIPNAVGGAWLGSLSCGSAGNCVAGGYYEGDDQWEHAFLVEEKNGAWGNAFDAPGWGHSTFSGVNSISCASAGNCSVLGSFGYPHPAGGVTAYIVDEVNGVWGTAGEVRGLAGLDTYGSAYGFSVSCVSDGNCAAGGYYSDYNDNTGQATGQAWVASEKNGSWWGAEEVPGLAALNRGGWAQVSSVSCGSPGYCAAGGFYSRGTAAGDTVLFVVTEKAGVWGKATKVPGIATLNDGGAVVNSISCRSAGNCSAGGYYTHASRTRAFVVSQKKGVWGKAIEVPGLAAFNANGPSSVSGISCAEPGKCAAVGYFTDKAHHQQAFVAARKHWKWGRAERVPGTKALNTGGDAGSWSVSCVPTGHCALAGYYYDSDGHVQASVTSP